MFERAPARSVLSNNDQVTIWQFDHVIASIVLATVYRANPLLGSVPIKFDDDDISNGSLIKAHTSWQASSHNPKNKERDEGGPS